MQLPTWRSHGKYTFERRSLFTFRSCNTGFKLIKLPCYLNFSSSSKSKLNYYFFKTFSRNENRHLKELPVRAATFLLGAMFLILFAEYVFIVRNQQVGIKSPNDHQNISLVTNSRKNYGLLNRKSRYNPPSKVDIRPAFIHHNKTQHRGNSNYTQRTFFPTRTRVYQMFCDT